jgi:hypothetical protein
MSTMLHNLLAVVEYFLNTIQTVIKTMLKGGMFGELVQPVEIGINDVLTSGCSSTSRSVRRSRLSNEPAARCYRFPRSI